MSSIIKNISHIEHSVDYEEGDAKEYINAVLRIISKINEQKIYVENPLAVRGVSKWPMSSSGIYLTIGLMAKEGIDKPDKRDRLVETLNQIGEEIACKDIESYRIKLIVKNLITELQIMDIEDRPGVWYTNVNNINSVDLDLIKKTYLEMKAKSMSLRSGENTDKLDDQEIINIAEEYLRILDMARIGKERKELVKELVLRESNGEKYGIPWRLIEILIMHKALSEKYDFLKVIKNFQGITYTDDRLYEELQRNMTQETYGKLHLEEIQKGSLQITYIGEDGEERDGMKVTLKLKTNKK